MVRTEKNKRNENATTRKKNSEQKLGKNVTYFKKIDICTQGFKFNVLLRFTKLIHMHSFSNGTPPVSTGPEYSNIFKQVLASDECLNALCWFS